MWNRSIPAKILLTLAMAMNCISASSALAATISVDNNNDLIATDSNCTLREAIMNANANGDTTGGDCTAGSGVDTIDLPSGTYTLAIAGQNEDANLTGDLDITDHLNLSGAGAATTIIQAGTNATNGIDRVLDIQGDLIVTIDGVTVRYGRLADANGGGVRFGVWAGPSLPDAALNITNAVITENNLVGVTLGGNYGGGLFTYRIGTVAVDATAVSDNAASTRSGGGAYIISASTLSITGSNFTGNTSGNSGGGLSGDNIVNATISASDFSQNTADSPGGGLEFTDPGGTISITNTTITGNTSNNDDGGALHILSGTADLDLTNVTVTGNNSGDEGGGIYVSSRDSTLDMINCTVENNTAANDGGGVFVDDNTAITITGGSISGNTANQTSGGGGGGIYALDATSLDITGATINGNNSNREGGGIYVENTPTLNFSSVPFTNNVAADESGGGVSVRNTTNLTITNSTFDNNTSDDEGAGIQIRNAPSGTITVSGSDFTNNTAGSEGGGFYFEQQSGAGPTIDITNSTFNGNTADGDGGGFLIDGATSTTMTNVEANNNIIGDNDNGGGINVTSDTLTISILDASGNTGGRDGGGMYADAGVVTIEQSTFINNTAATAPGYTAQGDGGGIYFSSFFGSSDALLTNVTITGNAASWSGGGIYSQRGLDITDSFVDNNSAVAQDGGGIAMDPVVTNPGYETPLTLMNTSVSNNSAGDYGGGIYCDDKHGGTTTITAITDSTVDGNTAPGGRGGGIYCEDQLDIDNTTVDNNVADEEGGGIYAGDALTVINGSSVSHNISHGDDGGGIYVYGEGTISDSTVDGNSAEDQGGGIYAGDEPVTVTNTSVSGNTSVGDGGGICMADSELLTITASTIDTNIVTDGSGGGIWSNGDVIVQSGSTVNGNSATEDGGGIFSEGSSTVSDSAVDGNSAGDEGGGMYADDGGSLTNSSVDNNTSGADGGGILPRDPLSVTSSTVSGNTATRDGGGIYSRYPLDITTSTLNGNGASTGGGLYFYPYGSSDALNITASTVSKNTASGAAADTSYVTSESVNGSGGGILLSTGSLNILNATVSGNTTALNGGGIWMDFPNGNISYTTIANNGAGNQGGGIYAISPGVVLQTSIVANNTATTAGPDCYDQGGLSNPGSGGSYNLISSLSPASGSGSCVSAFDDPTDIVNQTALLSPLQDNGGPTLTHALDPASPAMSQVPQASNGCGSDVSNDQRAESRAGTYVPTDQCEIGAWEAQFDDFFKELGDAPTAAQSGFANSYPTLLADDGARHTPTGPFMGAVIDKEPDGQPTAAADGDDLNSVPDDEDGVTFTSPITAGEQATVDVDLSNSSECLLSAWMDFNLDGDWSGAGEQIFTNESLTGGQINNLTYTVPDDAMAGASYARFRCSTQRDLSYTGDALDGEVEDEHLTITKPARPGHNARPVPSLPQWSLILLVLLLSLAGIMGSHSGFNRW